MKRALFALALAAALPMSAQASELSYSFVELDYVNSRAEILSSAFYGTEGYGLRGSYGFAENYYVSGGYTNSDFDASGSLNADPWDLGFGLPRAPNHQAELISIGGC